MLRNLRHFFHAQVKEIVEQHYELRYKQHQWAEVMYFLFVAFRSLCIIAMFYYNTEYYRYDFIGALAHYNKFYNQYFFMFVIGMDVLALTGKKVFFFTHVNTLSFQIIYDIWVRHTEIYWRNCKPADDVREIVSRRQLEFETWIMGKYRRMAMLMPNFLFNQLCQLAARLDVWRRLDHVDKQHFMREKMLLFPTISLQTRHRMIVWIDFLDLCIYASMIMFFVLAIFVIPYFCYILLPHFPWWYAFLFFTDLAIFFYMSVSLMQAGILFTLMATYCSITYIYHFNDLCRIFANVRARIRLHRYLSYLLTPSLKYVTKQHAIIVYYIVFTNRDVWGNALLLFVLVSVPLNAYMVSLTLMDSMSEFDILLMIFLIVAHATIGAIPMTGVAYSIEANYRFKKYIIPVQAGLGRERLGLKLKLEDTFGRMSHGRKYGLTIGPMSAITFTFLYELVLTYVAVFIFVLDKKREFEI